MKRKFKKIVVLCSALTLTLMSSLGNVAYAESVYQGKIGGNDVWHVTGSYHIWHEQEWIKLENRNINGGRVNAAAQISQALLANKLGRGYLKVIRHPDNKWTYEAVTWL